MLALAAALAFIAGFAVQRGGICAVRAVRDAVEEGDGRRFLALLECAGWAALLLLLANAAGLMRVPAWPAQASFPLAILGGALFGAGALINGACAFGTMGRLAAGELSFLAMPAGFVPGAVIAAYFAMQPRAQASFGIGAPWLWVLAFVLALFAGYRLYTAWRDAPDFSTAARRLRGAHWPPALAMAVTAFANVALLLLAASWPYTTLLVDAALMQGSDFALRATLVALFALGAFAGAWSAGRFAVRAPNFAALGASFAGGALMGAGAALTPGGNDALVLVGMPLMQPSAFAAYASMTGVIGLGFLTRRLARR